MPKIPESILKKMAERPNFNQERWVAHAFLGGSGLGLATKNIETLVKAYQKKTKNTKASSWDVTLAIINHVMSLNYLGMNVKLELLDVVHDQEQNVLDILDSTKIAPADYFLLIDTKAGKMYMPCGCTQTAVTFLPERYESLGAIGLPWSRPVQRLYRAKFTDWVKHFTGSRVASIQLYINELINA